MLFFNNNEQFIIYLAFVNSSVPCLVIISIFLIDWLIELTIVDLGLFDVNQLHHNRLTGLLALLIPRTLASTYSVGLYKLYVVAHAMMAGRAVVGEQPFPPNKAMNAVELST